MKDLGSSPNILDIDASSRFCIHVDADRIGHSDLQINSPPAQPLSSLSLSLSRRQLIDF